MKKRTKRVTGNAAPIFSVFSVSKSPFNFPTTLKGQDFVESGSELTSVC